MTVGNVSMDVSKLTGELNTRKGEYQAQAETIQGLFDDINANVNAANADYADDGIYNGSSNHKLAASTLSMDKVNQMSFEEVEALLQTADDSAEIATQLENQQKLYADYLAKFEKIQAEIEQYEADLGELIGRISTANSERDNATNDLESAQTAQAAAQRDLESAQAAADAAQVAYNEALEEEDIAISDNQANAYAEAMAEFLAQDCEEGDDDYKEFSDFYNEKLGNISHSSSASEDAENAMNVAARNVSIRSVALRSAEASVNVKNTTLTSKNTTLSNLQSQYSTKNNLYIGKKNALTTVSTNIQNLQTEITQLQTQMANVNFVNQNKDAIENIAYNKDPQVIAARETAGVVYATDANGNKDYSNFDLTKMISAEELALVKDNNLDLTEVLSNGYPRYVIAKARDGKFHIYERFLDEKGNPKNQLISLARTYGTGNGLKGKNIVPNGSGYMNSTKEVDQSDKNAVEVYYLTAASDLSKATFGNTFKTYSTGSPLSLDLNGDGVKTSNNIINYDIDGDGKMDRINDSADAVLVFDNDGDGISGEDGAECFGNNTDLDGDGKADGYKDGFEALKALALKAGLVNGKDDNVLDEKDLKFLELSYGLKIKAGGYHSESQSLADLGITQINLAQTDETVMHKNYDGMHNDLMTQEGATFIQNGEEKEYADIWHWIRPVA